MDKNHILMQRKELKERGHRVMRSHYFLLVFLCLAMMLFGTEFKQVINGISGYTSFGGGYFVNYLIEQQSSPVKENMTDVLLSSDDVVGDILSGHMWDGILKSDQLEQHLQETANDSSFLSRSEGELAKLVNTLWSGRLFTRLAQTIYSVTKSDRAVSVIFTIGGFLWFALVYLLLKNVYSAAMRRMFLEARMYSKVSYMDILHFAAVRKWLKAAGTLAFKYILEILWSFTVVGGIIKYYSYFAVPYIVAENPDMTPAETVTLSRKMMDGHKMELLEFQLTLIGWQILSIFTFGFSDMFYGAPYRMACYTEFYVRVREQAVEAGIPGTELLDDRYLFEKADKILLLETYFDVVDEVTLLLEERVELGLWQKRISDWFGLWIGSLELKKQHDDLEGRKYVIQDLKKSMDGLAYPQRLNPRWRTKEIHRLGHFSFMRSYSLWTLFLLFIVFSMIGWSWELALHFMQTGEVANRGVLHGPWLPIYGSGGVVVLLICSRFRSNPVAEFFTSILLCGTLEYFSAWYLEMKFHERWWSYDGYFLNLHGRICAEGLLVFGVGCCIVVYLIAPIFDFLLSKVKPKILIGICIVLAALFAGDLVYSQVHPNMTPGAVEVKKEKEEPAAAPQQN